MNLALRRYRSEIHVRPSGDAQAGADGGKWFWSLLILGVGAVVVWDWSKGKFTVSRNPETERWTLRREPLNSGGYTSRGKYFGRGAPLYRYDSPDGATGYVRGSTRHEAIEQAKQEHPSATFYGAK